MVIYIVHGSPRHNEQAARAKSGLGAPSDETTIVCSMDFDEKGKAKDVSDSTPVYDTRSACFQDAFALLVLVPPPKDAPAADAALGAQLGEYVEISRSKGRSARIFCLHHPSVDVGEITKLYPDEIITQIPGTASDVKTLIRAFYPNEERVPIIQTTTTLLLAAVEAQVPIERHTTASILTVTVLESDLARLSSGQIPVDASIGGDRWESMFGIDSKQAGLTWTHIRAKLANPDQWERILAEELEAVKLKHWQQNAVPILLDEKSNVPPAAAVVQKYEVYAGNFPDQNDPNAKLPSVHRFSMVIYRAPMLYDPGDERTIATAFHLLVVAQLFRFLVLEQDLKQLEKYHAQLGHGVADASKNIAQEIANLRRHLLFLDVESRRRNFLDRLVALDRLVVDSLPRNASDDEQRAAVESQNRLSRIFNTDWKRIKQELEAAIENGEQSLPTIFEKLEETKKLNAEVLSVTAGAYSALVNKEYSI